MAQAHLWSAVDVCSWLRGVGLGQYCDSVLEHDVTGAMLIDLIEHGGLGELGINRDLDRARIRTRLPLAQADQLQPHLDAASDESDSAQSLIWAIGGSDVKHFGPVAAVEMLDTRAGRWLRKPSLQVARQDLATIATSQSLWVLGGANFPVDKFGRASTTSIVEQFDIRADRWLPVSDVPTCRRGFAVALIGTKIYTLGGQEGKDPPPHSMIGQDLEDPGTLRRTTVESFDLQSRHWSGAAPLPTGREYLGAASIGKKIYAIGGTSYAREEVTYAAVEIMDTATGQWISGLPMNQARARFGVAKEGHAGLYVVGGHAGRCGQRCLNHAERLDFLTGQWSNLPEMPTARAGLGAAILGTSFYAVGGCASGNLIRSDPVAKVEVLDLGTQRWMEGPPLLHARHSLGIVAS